MALWHQITRIPSKPLLLALANRADKVKHQAYPSIADLQRTTRLSRRATQYALRGLEEKNALQTIPATSKRGSSTYRLTIPRISHCHHSASSSIYSTKLTRAPGAPPPCTTCTPTYHRTNREKKRRKRPKRPK